MKKNTKYRMKFLLGKRAPIGNRCKNLEKSKIKKLKKLRGIFIFQYEL
jgi:hypothetical protein